MDAATLLARFPDFVREVRDLSPEGFWLILALLILGTGAAFYFIWRSFHRARLIEDTPTARIRSAHQGYVELEGAGRLLDGTPIVGPLTGTHCLWYRYKIEHRESHRDSRGRGSSSWSTIQSGVSDGLFVIEDATGRCIIDPDGAEVITVDSDVWYGRDEFPRQGPTRAKSWFRLGSGDYRYTEERLMPGPVYALGWFNTVRNAPGDVNGEVALLLRDWKADQPGLLARFDRNGDGRIDPTEWDTAREAALQEVIRLRSHRPHAPVSNVLARAPSDRHPFLISAVPQQVLSARYRRRALIALALTLTGVVATILYVGARFAQPG
ncbi:MAG TPA: GIDE domain-containing protein [Gammaproteobacteria bacterium]